MEIFKVIVCGVCIYYGVKIFMLLFSCLFYKFMNMKIKRVKVDGILNGTETKGMVILTIPITNKTNINDNIVSHYRDIITGYKKVKVIFITCEKEEIEVRLKHNDEKNARDILIPQIEEANKKLDRSDAIRLIHYPYDDDNKSRMIEYAVKEFMQSYSSAEKISSYIGIFDSAAVLNDSLISMLEKTFKKYKYPKIIELVNIKSLLVNKADKNNKINMHDKANKYNKWLLYLYNVNKTIDEFIKMNFNRVIRRTFLLDKLLPYDIDLDGSFIRLDLFYEEEMFGMCQMKEVVSMNYYFKDAKVKTLYLINNNEVVKTEEELEKILEDEFIYLHLLKSQCEKINKYRLPNKKKTFIVKVLSNIRMTLKSVSSYLITLSLLTLIFSKEINILKLLIVIVFIYTFILLAIFIYEILIKSVNHENRYTNSLITKIISIFMYPLYLLYKTNGCYDYIRNRSRINKVNTSGLKEIR